jgi:methylated-DNA-[protein]-cysteine S-methyltransferase
LPSDSHLTSPTEGSQTVTAVCQTPIGQLHITSNGLAILRASFEEMPETVSGTDFLLQEAISVFTAYFQGKHVPFDLPLAPIGSDFQQLVWRHLQQIPFGKVISYQELAEACGGPTFTRAVANANAANPIIIGIPCHRVIGSNGRLTGYSGGLWRKKWLLDHESPATQISLF